MRDSTLGRRLYLLLAQSLGVFLLLSAGIAFVSLHRYRDNVRAERLLLARSVSFFL